MKYVGKTKSFRGRWVDHLHSGPGFLVSGICILEEVPIGGDSDAAEKKWIAFFGRENLWNRTNGGSAAWAYPVSDETRAKMSASIRRAFADDPTIQARRLSTLKSSGSEQRRVEAIGKATKMQWENPEIRKRRSDGIRRAYQNPETKARMVAGIYKALADPEKKKRMIKGFLMIAKDPKIRKRRAETLRKTQLRRGEIIRAINHLARFRKTHVPIPITYL